MTQSKYEQKRRECWEEFKRKNIDGEVQWQPLSRYDVFCAAFDRAYILGTEEKDAEGEEMLTVSRSEVQRLYTEAQKVVPICEHDMGFRNSQIITLTILFGSKCMPDNVDSLDANVDSIDANVDSLDANVDSSELNVESLSHQITAIAREYVEECIDPQWVQRGAYEEMVEEEEESMVSALLWLSRRFFIVEKGKVRRQFEYAQRLIGSRDYNKQCIGVGSQGILQRLFPEIAKEV